MDNCKVAPSILSADFANLARDVARMRNCDADMLHVDVMDGHFVPNITIGAPVVKSLRAATDLPLDVHLMIAHPGCYISAFADAGADILTIHAEIDGNVGAVLSDIRRLGMKAGLSLKPGTPADAAAPFLPHIDLLLVMTVNPGFGAQTFMPELVPKVRELRRMAPLLDIAVDGGINADTAPIARDAGANILVSGSYLFTAADPKAAIAHLKG